jgi:hypothetical protein
VIICHKYKFIFLKTNKTAGTSIEIALSKFCDSDDIITPISPDDEAMRSSLGHRGPQHHLSSPWEYNPRDLALLALKGKKKLRYYNHISAAEVSKKIGPEIWDSYYKFCFERNPWDRVVSLYFWKHSSEPRPSLSEFLAAKPPRILKQRGIDLYTINGRIAVDRVCRFESLTDDLEAVRLHLGIPEKLDLPRAKSHFRKVKGNYRDMYNDIDRERVAELFADEIKLFGYQF